MKIKNLAPILSPFQRIAIYEAAGEDIGAVFADLYTGRSDEIPPELLARDIVSVGVYDRGILEIQARRV